MVGVVVVGPGSGSVVVGVSGAVVLVVVVAGGVVVAGDGTDDAVDEAPGVASVGPGTTTPDGQDTSMLGQATEADGSVAPSPSDPDPGCGCRTWWCRPGRWRGTARW